jgi:hypothetical protein
LNRIVAFAIYAVIPLFFSPFGKIALQAGIATLAREYRGALKLPLAQRFQRFVRAD